MFSRRALVAEHMHHTNLQQDSAGNSHKARKLADFQHTTSPTYLYEGELRAACDKTGSTSSQGTGRCWMAATRHTYATPRHRKTTSIRIDVTQDTKVKFTASWD